MSDQIDMLDVVHRETEALRFMSIDMNELASALTMVGNRELAEKIDVMAAMLFDSQEEIVNAVHSDIQNQVDASMEQVGKTFSALLEKTG